MIWKIPIRRPKKINWKRWQSCSKTEKGSDFRPLKLKSSIPQFPKEKYCEMVEKAKHYIHEGDIFQVVLSNPMRAKAEGSLFDTYRVLRATNPSPYMFYFSSDDIEMAGASPETLVKLEDGTLKHFPTGRNKTKRKNREEDKALETELLTDEKELGRAQHAGGSGKKRYRKDQRDRHRKSGKIYVCGAFFHVMHIGSTVTGRSGRTKMLWMQWMPSCRQEPFPEHRRFRACQIIEELEQANEAFTAEPSVILDFAGNLDTCIAIRLVYKKNGEICIRSGAGIVADSVPEKEFEECQ